MAHEKWEKAVVEGRRGEQVGAGSSGWWGSLRESPGGGGAVLRGDLWAKNLPGARTTWAKAPRGQPAREVCVCGRGRGEGLQEVEVVSSVCGGTEELGDLESMGLQRVGH